MTTGKRTSNSRRKGGRTTLLKYGREHYRALAAKSNAVPRQPRPPRYPVRMELRLTTAQAQALADWAQRSGRRRAQLVRQAVDWWLTHEMGEGSVLKR